ncbi:MurR/RpiR family transcriptional regulator [Acetobacter thailandicus]|uniref:MurR/RpiR family transcriptional regulator n=1 Tax=Acetobacter thailandicus TaxID=1502842 RepID=UPI001BA50C40|nr:MurR/RpiR family transcriptional regulator [Acetobacter thailandicus]MBS0981000.1 MurR/RpiR family transcriptional regulator [Acetobacter thailandicus]
MTSETVSSSDDYEKTIENYDNFYHKLRQRYDGLSPRLRQFADFVVSHPEEFAMGKAKVLSETAGVQPSTIVRFAHALGFESFSELHSVFKKYFFQRSLQHEAWAAALRRSDGQPARAGNLLDGFCRAAGLSLDAVCRETRPERLEAAADILASARVIYILGLKESMPVARLVAYYFSVRGIAHCLIGLESGMEYDAIRRAGPEDAAVVLSFSPYFEQTTELSQRLESYGVSMVAFTDRAASPVIPKTGLWFECREADHRGFRFHASAFLLGAVLACAVSERRRPTPVRQEAP